MPTKGKRSPTMHRTPAQVRKWNREGQATPKEVKKRVTRNKARREAIKDGRVKKGDGKEVHHVRPLSRGGSGKKSNTRVTSAKKNRGHGLTRKRPST